MNIDESIEILKNMILMPDGWIIGKDYKGNLEFIGCPEGQEAIETLLTAYEKEKEKNKELESDIQQKNFEIKCLNSDIKNMYCEEGVIAILEDNFDLSREEAIQILEEE